MREQRRCRIIDVMTQTPPAAEPVQLDPIKTKHRAMWALGDYDKVATELVSSVGETLVRSAGVRAGQSVLDVAAGSGAAAIPAARLGATVTASDLTPELLETGRVRAEAEGLALRWRQADAEHLPCATAEYDVVLSAIGVMFAPFHQPVADELVRVTRQGGTIAVANWTPAGLIGQVFATLKPYAAPPPAGASPGPLWGTEAHVAGLFGARVRDLRSQVHTVHVDAFESGQEFRDFFKTNYGPMIAAYRNIADQPERVGELDQALVDLADQFGVKDGTFDWDYLVVVATKA